LFKTTLWSEKLANAHFWIGTLGIVMYALPMYVAGFVQAFMWKQFEPDGSLTYGNFLETVNEIMPMYWMRAIGGSLYIVGMIMLIYNVLATIKQGQKVTDDEAQAAPLSRVTLKRTHSEGYHTWLERRPVRLTIYATITILIGGAVQIIPSLTVDEYVPKISSVKPYTPLELEGRDLYIRESCNACHSQMIRPFRSEVERYDWTSDKQYSKSGEYVYDHPFLWGSKRTGPDLHRIGGKYSDNWHFNHMYDPQSVSQGSIMPSYKWMIRDALDKSDTEAKMQAMITLGVPYSQEEVEQAQNHMDEQGQKIEDNLMSDPDFARVYLKEKEAAKANGEAFVAMKDREIVALIAYLQRLGTDIKLYNTKQDQ
jgi:cytochrome c oxidase cbb3-type subunit I/II